MANIKLLDLDVNLDDSFQLVELSDEEPTAITGGAIGGVGGYVAGWGAAVATGSRRWYELVGAGLWGAAGGAIAGSPAGPVGASLATPK